MLIEAFRKSTETEDFVFQLLLDAIELANVLTTEIGWIHFVGAKIIARFGLSRS